MKTIRERGEEEGGEMKKRKGESEGGKRSVRRDCRGEGPSCFGGGGERRLEGDG